MYDELTQDLKKAGILSSPTGAVNSTSTRGAIAGFQKSNRSKTMDAKLEHIHNKVLKLRQACCHPQLGSQGIKFAKRTTRSGSVTASRKIMSMDGIHRKLIDSVLVKCEEFQRLRLFSLCGIAGVQKILAQAARYSGNREGTMGGARVYMEHMVQALSAYVSAVSLFEENRTECYSFARVAVRTESDTALLVELKEEQSADHLELVWRVPLKAPPRQDLPSGYRTEGDSLMADDGSKREGNQCT